ncbi:threonine--tRNA ligase [Rhodococcus sp. Eu-32]|uniref:threonine--tRNA ligase n=1 Tax=Rhodococcus sp. Eu-32 TaxID=1017319 RepID=UPI000DF1F30A|nr:threonine--tRNA ligase [Rhodococcus sp. Eu-32]RRQ29213.1 threonine--tRNA ligase [Rhodococcus sp. Eu-32]
MTLDHRELNRDMSVFTANPLVGSGLPMWLPAGAVIRHELEALAKEIAREDGCLGVYSPVLGKRALYERSGHLSKFGDDMFPAMRLGEDELMLRPANCPHHALMYASATRSYRELPIRLNELAAMFRAERSGVVSGLSRVRQINLDDTHVFCRADQVFDEAQLALRSAIRAQQILGLPVDYVRLSMRDESSSWLGTDAQWASGQKSLRDAAAPITNEHGLELVEAAGEAAFYGPKLDLQVRDSRGHEQTIATVQLDFNQPERFGLEYTGQDGRPHRPVMIHRGTLGSMERVTAAMLEHYQGRLPFWLAPIHIALLPVGVDQDDAVRSFADAAARKGLRPNIDQAGALGARIRHARARRDHLIGVVGPEEVEAETVQVTDIAGGVRRQVRRDELLALMLEAQQSRLRSPRWESLS